jgi:acyl-CoA thioesterase-1
MKALSLFIFILIASTTSSEENNSILIYGDSISAGYGMEKESQWSESLKTLLSDKGFKISVYNRSLSGETTGGGLTRISRILDELKPTFLLLELGGNDALRGYPPKKIYENLDKIIEASKERGINVFLMQIRILPNYGKRYQTQFESIYPTLSQEKEVILLPFMLNDIALKKELMLSDGIHPNVDAQPLIAEIVFNSLKPHLK